MHTLPDQQGFKLVTSETSDETERDVRSSKGGQDLRDTNPLSARKPELLDDPVRNVAAQIVHVDCPVKGRVQCERVYHGSSIVLIVNGVYYQGFGMVDWFVFIQAEDGCHSGPG